MYKFLFPIVFLCLIGCQKQFSTSFYQIDKIELRDLHNKYRHSPVSLHIALDEAAQNHATWMAKNKTLSHVGENQSSPFDRLTGKKWTTAAENIAEGQDSPQEVVNDWMRSIGHRNNILNQQFKYVGFGIATSENGTTYWCAVFSD